MNDRVFICTHSVIPKGDANSNYIWNLALSLAHAGMNVVVIGKSKGENREEGYLSSIRYINIGYKEHWASNLLLQFSFGKQLIKELETFNAGKDDYFILYGGFLSLFESVAKEKKFDKGKIITCVVEWPTSAQFKLGYFDPHYMFWHRVFYRWMPNWGKVITISKNLSRHFSNNNCETFLLPPMIDSEKTVKHEQKSNTSKIKFVYSGSDIRKDAIKNMLLSVPLLTKEEQKKFEFHVTGLTIEKAKNLLAENSSILEECQECLFIHGWVDYEELVNIYNSSDFLLLAREENRFTISNFPSKVPEMMNYGIIPVCSEVGDYTSEYLTNEFDCLTFSGCSAEDCAGAVHRALSLGDEQRQLLQKNALQTAKKFDYRNYAQDLLSFLKTRQKS